MEIKIKLLTSILDILKTMNYIKCIWKHNFDDEPIFLYSELNDNNYETRKIEIWKDGKRGYASEKGSSQSTALGIVPVPSIQEINNDKQFQAEIITKQEFEIEWQKTLINK